MAEKVVKLGVKREPGYLYFLRGTNVYKTAMKRAGGPTAVGKAEPVISGGFQREEGYLYFLDADGDISRARRAVGRRKQVAGVRGRARSSEIGALIPRQAADVILPPGMKLREWLALFFSQHTCETVFDNVIADMQKEWLEAHEKGDTELATWVQVRGRLTLAITLAVFLLRSLYDLWMNRN